MLGDNPPSGSSNSSLRESPIDRDIGLGLALPGKILRHPVRDEPEGGARLVEAMENALPGFEENSVVSKV